jgi:CubicO group peptidase (beta-lactamase class C family)
MAYSYGKNCLYYSILGLFLLIFQSLSAQKPFARADAYVQEQLPKLGGKAVLMIYHNGKIVHSESFTDIRLRQKMGARLLARKTGKDPEEILQPFTSSSKIMIASCSKWLSAALVMRFVDDGKLRLTDTVGQYLPLLSKYGKGSITIAQCLSHQTGVASKGLSENRELMQLPSMDAAMEWIGRQPMETEPGKGFHYSSVGLQIAGAVLEKISGASFESLFQQYIALPCNMTQTDFGNGKLALPAGGARSTAADYLNFLVMLLNNGTVDGKQVLKPESVALMQHNYAAGKDKLYTPAEASGWGYGFGAWVKDLSDPALRSAVVTSPGLFGTFPWIDYDRHYAAVLLTFNLHHQGRHALYNDLKAAVDEGLDAAGH